MSGSVSLIDGRIDELQTCPVCGKEFTPSFNRQQKYCSAECGKIAKKQKDREYYKAYYREGKTIRKPKKDPVTPRVQVKSRSLDTLSGDELLRYGTTQQSMNADILSVKIPQRR